MTRRPQRQLCTPGGGPRGWKPEPAAAGAGEATATQGHAGECQTPRQPASLPVYSPANSCIRVESALLPPGDTLFPGISHAAAIGPRWPKIVPRRARHGVLPNKDGTPSVRLKFPHLRPAASTVVDAASQPLTKMGVRRKQAAPVPIDVLKGTS